MSDENEITGSASTAATMEAVEDDGVLTEDQFLGRPGEVVELIMGGRGTKNEAVAQFSELPADTLRDYKNLLTGNFGRKQPNQKAAFDLITDKCFVGFVNFKITDPEFFEKFEGTNVKGWLKRAKRGQRVQENIVPTYMGMVTPTVEEKN